MQLLVDVTKVKKEAVRHTVKIDEIILKGGWKKLRVVEKPGGHSAKGLIRANWPQQSSQTEVDNLLQLAPFNIHTHLTNLSFQIPDNINGF